MHFIGRARGRRPPNWPRWAVIPPLVDGFAVTTQEEWWKVERRITSGGLQNSIVSSKRLDSENPRKWGHGLDEIRGNHHVTWWVFGVNVRRDRDEKQSSWHQGSEAISHTLTGLGQDRKGYQTTLSEDNLHTFSALCLQRYLNVRAFVGGTWHRGCK